MKRVYKNLGFLSLTGLICLFLAFPAYAQHNHGGGHNGGGGHNSSGGGGHYSGGSGHASYAQPARQGAVRSFNGRQVRTNVRGNYNGRAGVNAYRGRAGVNTYRGRAGYAGRGNYGRGYAGRGYAGRGGYARGGWYGRGWYGGWHGWFAPGGWYFHGGFYGSLYYPRLGFSLGFLPYGYYPFYWDNSPYYYSDGYFYQQDNGQYTVVEPPVGAEVNALPNGAKSIMINGEQFYELNGVYYVAVTKDDGSLAYQVTGKDGELNTDDQNGQDDQGQGDVSQDNQGNYNPPANMQGGNQGNYNPPANMQGDNQGNNPPPANVQGDGAGPQVGDLVAELPKGTRKITINGTKMYVSPDDVYYQETRDNNNQKAYKIVGLPSDEPDNQ